MDNFDGHRFRGWHHNFTLVILAWAFLQLHRRSQKQEGAPRKLSMPSARAEF